MRPSDLVGKVFGKLTVITKSGVREVGLRKAKHTEWVCVCECGKETKATTGYLQSGDTMSCGCAKTTSQDFRFIDLTGKVFGRWVVLSEANRTENQGYEWLCRCECGIEKIVLGKNLTRNLSKSCGCYGLEVTQTKTGKYLTPDSCCEILLKEYVRNAQKRHLSFSIPLEHFKYITSQDCYYCGVSPYQKTRAAKIGTPYVYNGIDRKDNKVGYEIYNCIPCCGPCNKAKCVLKFEDFILWIQRLTNFNSRVPLIEII